MSFKDHQATFDMLKKIASALVQMFAPFCEVVIHDFADAEHSVVHIEGNITGRSIGGSATDLLLERLKLEEEGKKFEDDVLCNYLTSLPGGKLMKSSTVFLRNEAGKIHGAFCVNFEISQLTNFASLLGTLVGTGLADNNITEMLSDDINETLQAIISESILEMDGVNPFMSREGKIELIRRLDEKGLFQVKKVVTLLAYQLGISRATIYNYLKEARQGLNGGADSRVKLNGL